ncbi:MAG TPA: PDZ domain-containing protein [Bacteroidota bacterium]|nr:PDZ domain-containing protein [Bacteroidota bacterium]
MRLTQIIGIVLPLLMVGSASACNPIGHAGHVSAVMYVKDDHDGWLGVSIRDVTPRLAREKDLKVNEGAYVADVEDESPADLAGIRKGDVIVQYEDAQITDADDLIDRVRRTKPGTEVSIVVMRDGEQATLKATIERRPREPRVFSFRLPPVPRFHVWPEYEFSQTATVRGLRVETLTKQLGEYFGAPKGRGVLVKSVRKESDADKAGFKAGDVIVKVEDETIADVDDLLDALRTYRKRDRVEVEIIRKGASQKISWTLGREDEDVSWEDFDEEIIIDLYTPDQTRELRIEADARLLRKMEEMRKKIEERLWDLKERLIKRHPEAPTQVRTT